MANFFRKIFALFFSDNQTPPPEVLPLSKKYVKYITTGMYWFTDDTFSSKLQEGKNLRALVVDRDGRQVLALLFDEQGLVNDQNGDYRVYNPQTLINHRQMDCVKFVPDLKLLQIAHYHVDLLNQKLKEANKPLIHGLYWSWDNNKPGLMYNVEKGEKKFARNGDTATLRYALDAFVRR